LDPRIEPLGVTSRGSSSTRRPRRAGATRWARITKRNPTMIETSGSGRTTIGVRTPRTASAWCVSFGLQYWPP